MCEEHFNFLSSSARVGLYVCFGDLAGLFTRRLVDTCRETMRASLFGVQRSLRAQVEQWDLLA